MSKSGIVLDIRLKLFQVFFYIYNALREEVPKSNGGWVRNTSGNYTWNEG